MDKIGRNSAAAQSFDTNVQSSPEDRGESSTASQGGTVRNFPDEVVIHILKYLPTEDLKEASSTCRQWYRASSEPTFIFLKNKVKEIQEYIGSHTIASLNNYPNDTDPHFPYLSTNVLNIFTGWKEIQTLYETFLERRPNPGSADFAELSVLGQVWSKRVEKFNAEMKGVERSEFVNIMRRAASETAFINFSNLGVETKKLPRNFYLTQEFLLFSENQRFEIFKAQAKVHTDFISEAIQRFNFSEEQRFEIAKVAFENHKWSETIDGVAHGCVNELSESFSNYNLTREDYRFEIAKIVARNAPQSLLEEFETYDITNPEYGLILARTLASHPDTTLPAFIESFNLQDETGRFEIAKETARQSGLATSVYIDSFNLSDEHNFEIAKIAASTEKSLEDYRADDDTIEEEGVRYGIQLDDDSYAILSDDGSIENERIQYFITYYTTLSEEQRFEVAMIAAYRNKERVIDNIDHYNLTDEHKTEIIEIATPSDAQ